jgi:hypothetical protein
LSASALPTDFLVTATLRRCQGDNIPAFLVRRGDAERGTILLKLNRLEGGIEIWSQIRDLKGELNWLQALQSRAVDETEANAYVEKALDRDPDLWVMEIEDRMGKNPFI